MDKGKWKSITKKSATDKGKNPDNANKDELDRDVLCESVDKSVFDLSHVEIQSKGLASADDSSRELQSSKFKRKRNQPIGSLQTVLKTRRYEDALNIVSQYRFAADIDADFTV